jgi:hypothetical protein
VEFARPAAPEVSAGFDGGAAGRQHDGADQHDGGDYDGGSRDAGVAPPPRIR